MSIKFVGEKTVGLEERASADAVGQALRLIGQFRGADCDQRLLHPFLPLAESHDASDLRHGCAQFFSPRPHSGTARFRSAENFNQQLRVVRIGEEFDLAHPFD